MKAKVNKICVAFYLVVAIFSFQVSANEAVVTYVKGKVEVNRNDQWIYRKKLRFYKIFRL